MRRSKRRFIALVLGLISLVLLLCLLLFISPSTSWTILFITINSSLIFFVLTGLTAYFLPTFFFKSRKHGILISIFLILYFLFRLWGLTHPFFALLLLALFLTLELLFTRKQA